MDPELRAYLEAMEGRLATRADVTGLRTEILAVRAETAELRTGMDALRAETAEQFVAVRAETAELRAEVAEQLLGLHVAVRTVREQVDRAEKRLNKSIRAWKLESSLALREIERLHRSMGRLTRRVRRVELRRA